MQKFYRGEQYHGLKEIIPVADNSLVGFSLLKLNRGEEWSGDSGVCEVVLVILGGKADVEVADRVFADLGRRNNVFEGPATAVYVPRESGYKVRCAGEFVEIALCLVKAEKKYRPFVVRPEEVKMAHRGGSIWQRDVHDIIVENGEGRVDRIVVGETYNDPGNWSSFPPHKHDRVIPGVETALVEVYHYRIEPESAFGVQILYGGADDGEAHLIRSADTVYIPDGYHPVAAPPSVKIYYLWFLAGTCGRQLIPHDDPAFARLHELETAKDGE